MCLLACSVGCSVAPTAKVDRWAVAQGGCIDGSARDRATAALARLQINDLPGVTTLSVQVLDSDRPGAYAWPCSRLFVTRGLVELLNADELSAALAHEVGHLTTEPSPVDGVALASDSHDDCEVAADEAGRKLLTASGLPSSALVTMLQKVADHPRTGSSVRSHLLRRATLFEQSAHQD